MGGLQTVSAAMEIAVGKIRMRNPVMTASGTAGYGPELAAYFPLDRLGAFVTKAVTCEPRQGNETPRLAETRAGMINAIGLANVGLDAFLAEKLPWLRKQDVPVIVNVAGSTVDEYVEVAGRLDEADGVAGIELNISCPNVRRGGMEFGRSEPAVREVVAAVRKAVRRSTYLVKLSPNVTDITAIAAAAVAGGADVLSMINTFTAMAVDIERRRPILANVTGGLSGPCIRPVAVHMVHQVYKKVAGPAGVPIIGMGGIQYASDAIEFLLAGATGLAVGTALFVDPGCLTAIRDGISDYLQRHGCKSIREIIGQLQMPE